MAVALDIAKNSQTMRLQFIQAQNVAVAARAVIGLCQVVRNIPADNGCYLQQQSDGNHEKWNNRKHSGFQQRFSSGELQPTSSK